MTKASHDVVVVVVIVVVHFVVELYKGRCSLVRNIYIQREIVDYYVFVGNKENDRSKIIDN